MSCSCFARYFALPLGRIVDLLQGRFVFFRSIIYIA